MANSVNKVTLIGRIGRPPEIRQSTDGLKIVTFSVATSDVWKDKVTNERKEKTEWHRVVIFNEKLAELAERFLQKGSKVFVEGQLQTRKWIDAAGVEKYATEIVLSRFRGDMVFLDAKNGEGAPTGSDYGMGDKFEDDIPGF